MIALALALAYLGTLAFVGFLLVHGDSYRASVLDKVNEMEMRLGVLSGAYQASAPKWDHAAGWVEARELERGLTGRASRG